MVTKSSNQETIEHVVEHCPKYNQERQTLTEQLAEIKIKLGVNYCKENLGNSIFYSIDECRNLEFRSTPIQKVAVMHLRAV